MKLRLKNILAWSLFPQIVLVKWLGSYPELIEKYYSHGIYPVISVFMRRCYGWIPFSIGDVAYAGLIIALIIYLVRRGNAIWREWKTSLTELFLVLSVMYCTFHLLWGFNYYRVPLSKAMEIESSYTPDQLFAITEQLIEQTNALQLKITGDPKSPVDFPMTKPMVFDATLAAYKQMGNEYTQFNYPIPSIKNSLWSTLLSYMGYGGYLNPFTLEAHVNRKIPKFRFPIVVSHEIAHQLGYSAENEANFVGYLITANQEDLRYRYSASAYAMAYCLQELHRSRPYAHQFLKNRISEGVKSNFKTIEEFWAAYANPAEPFFKWFFNNFLRANNQPAGIRSYSRIVNLLIGYHEEHPLK